jgi:hypothetical protein
MRKSAFYPTAVVLAILALFLNFMAHEQWHQASNHRAGRIATAHLQHIQYVQDAKGASLVQTARVLTVVGVALMLSGAACTVVALFRREEGWYLILSGLLMSDILALMLL